jgi:hypothetical protein
LIAPLQIGDTSTEIQNQLKVLEQDYPELRDDTYNAAGDTSGIAIELARQRVETRVNKRRPNYDNALVRAQQMAIAIGGFRKYKGYEGFGLDSYAAGLLDHSIGERPVFKSTRGQELAQAEVFWRTAQSALAAGIPIETYLRRSGWSDADLQEIYDNAPAQ